ncbi:MAG: MFS transporter [Candidatus Gastranaerophilales bacterium]|nr:MFS transporter [Candidatus Gastranaerophilales bacterium]
MIYEKGERKPQIWLSGAHFINDVYTGVLNPIMPFVAEQIRISMPVATIILSCSHIFASLLQPFFGFFADKMRKRALIFWGLIFTSCFITLAPSAKSVLPMVIFIILGSLGSSLLHPQALGLVPKFSVSKVEKNMGIFIASGALGFSFGPLVSSAIAQYLGLDRMFVMSALGVFWAMLMFAMVPKFSNIPAEPKTFHLFQAFRDILSNRKLNILNIIALLKSLMTTSCSILLPFLWKSMGYSKVTIGVALFVFLFLGGIASLISPKIEQKIGTANVFYLSMITTCPLMLLFMLTYKTMPMVSFVIFGLIGFFTMFAMPVTMSMAQRVLPQYKSIIGGFINGFSWGVVAIAMTIIGFVAQATSIAAVLTIISFIPAIFSVLVKELFKEEKV